MYLSNILLKIEEKIMIVEKTKIRENIEWTNMRWNEAPNTSKEV